MEPTLRKLAVLVGIGLLAVSIFWSQDGFNFDLAGHSQYGNMATFIGWFLALSVTTIQFVFSTSYKELNASLKFFGILAYIYSIYTNYWGILNFQGWVEGQPPFQLGAGILAFVMDGVPEPLIAWGLYESLRGDFIGNLMKIFGTAPQKQQQNLTQYQTPEQRYTNREQRHAEMRQTSQTMKSTPEYPFVSFDANKISSPKDFPPFLQNTRGKQNGNVRK